MVKGNYLTSGQAADRLGVSIPTVKSLVADGSLRSFTTNGGHYRIDSHSIHEYLTQEDIDETQLQQEERQIAIYARVSSQSQASDGSLTRQIERLLTEVSKREQVDKCDISIYKDISSALEDRDGLNSLIDCILDRKISKIYIEYKDRLSRTCCLTKLIEHISQKFNVDIIYLDLDEIENIDTEYFVKELLDYCNIVVNRTSSTKSKKVTIKNIDADIVRKILKLREEGHSVSSIANIAKNENLKNDRGEIISSYMIDKIVYDQSYGLKAQPNQIAREWLITNIIRTDGSRLMNKDLMSAYEKYCQQNCIKSIARSDLGLLMKEIFGGRYRTQGSTAWRNVSLVI